MIFFVCVSKDPVTRVTPTSRLRTGFESNTVTDMGLEAR
jgi:hypothetical protein